MENIIILTGVVIASFATIFGGIRTIKKDRENKRKEEEEEEKKNRNDNPIRVSGV